MINLFTSSDKQSEERHKTPKPVVTLDRIREQPRTSLGAGRGSTSQAQKAEGENTTSLPTIHRNEMNTCLPCIPYMPYKLPYWKTVFLIENIYLSVCLSVCLSVWGKQNTKKRCLLLVKKKQGGNRNGGKSRKLLDGV